MTNQSNDFVSKYGNITVINCPKTGGTAPPSNFPSLKESGIGTQKICIPPGHILTPHWHPNSNETTYCMGGSGVVVIMVPDASAGPIGATAHKFPYAEGDVVFLPQGYAHYFHNTGEEDLVLYLTFENPDFDIQTFADVYANLPKIISDAAIQSAPKAASSPVIPVASMAS